VILQHARIAQARAQVLGMDLLSELPQSNFTLYFLGYDHSDGAHTAEEKAASRFSREGV
jgi:lactoylglutathione lyase